MQALIALFPSALIVLNVWSIAAFWSSPGPVSALAAFSTLYLAAPIAQRLFETVRPLNETVEAVDEGRLTAWRAARQFQAYYDALPFLEALLRLVPGAYSLWLRLWGAQIGYGVQWPAQMEIHDRSLLEVGNRVTLEPGCVISASAVRRNETGRWVLVKRVRLGDRAVIGQGAQLDAGARVPRGMNVPAGLRLRVNETLGSGVAHGSPEEAALFADDAPPAPPAET